MSEILSRYVQTCSKKPFQWGVNDCLIFVSDWCILKTNKDPMSKKYEDDPDTIRGAYTRKSEAYLLIKKYRGGMNQIMDAHFDKIAPHFARSGDIVTCKFEDGICFGIVIDGIKASFLRKNHGIVLNKVSNCDDAWRVC